MFAELNFCQGKSERVFRPNEKEMWETGLILLFLFIISNVLIILTSIISFSHIAVCISYNEIQDFICFCEYRFLSYVSLVSPVVSGWPSTSPLFYGGGGGGGVLTGIQPPLTAEARQDYQLYSVHILLLRQGLYWELWNKKREFQTKKNDTPKDLAVPW